MLVYNKHLLFNMHGMNIKVEVILVSSFLQFCWCILPLWKQA